MNTDLLALVTAYAGLIGLSCWFVASADHLYRLGLPRTRRSARYDLIDGAFVALGSVLVAGFVAGLLVLIGVQS